MRELLLGCGNRRIKELVINDKKEFQNVTTVDNDVSCHPDYVLDLNSKVWSKEFTIQGIRFDEVHAYEVLEHLGRQGDEESFFSTFRNIWDVLEDDGFLLASTPSWSSIWAWGDPGHKRIICEGSLAFLDQDMYEAQVGKTPMSDYRGLYWPKPYDFKIHVSQHQNERFYFVLQKKNMYKTQTNIIALQRGETSSSSETTHTTLKKRQQTDK